MATRKPRRDDAAPADDTAGTGAGERGVAVAVPADRRVRLPVRLPHRLAGRARRVRRLAVRPPVRLGERVRHPARPRGGTVPVRPVRHQRAVGPALRARHQRAGDDVEDAAGLGRGARRADDGAEHRRRHRHAPHAAADRRRRRAHAGPGRRVPRGTGRDGGGVRAGVRLRAGAGDVVDRRRRRPRRRGDRRRRHDAAAHRPARRRRRRPGRGAVTCSRPGERLYCALSWAADFAAPGRRRATPRRGSTPRWRSGGAGWTGPGSPTTATGSRSSARRSPSRV